MGAKRTTMGGNFDAGLLLPSDTQSLGIESSPTTGVKN
jgi:hypothetical protein